MTREHRACARAFTLIEVLVVVAIIALLVSVLLPSLSRAREQAKAAVCLAQMHQMGLGFSAYSSDSKGKFPRAAQFRYALMAGEFEWFDKGRGDLWLPANIGGLYPKYINRQALLFYCPSCLQLRPEDPNFGIPRLQYLTKNPVQGGQGGPHNPAGASPHGTYVYARPAGVGKHPRDAGSKMYPKGEVLDSDAVLYANDNDASIWPVPIGKAARMNASMPAFVSDAYMGGYEGIHIGGFNVLFADLHGRRVNDVNGKIAKDGPTSGHGYEADGGMNNPSDSATAKQFEVWDYFGQHP